MKEELIKLSKKLELQNEFGLSWVLRKIASLEDVIQIAEADQDHFYKAEISQGGKEKIGYEDGKIVKNYTGRLAGTVAPVNLFFFTIGGKKSHIEDEFRVIKSMESCIGENSVSAFELGEAGGTKYIKMEKVKGVSLRKFLDNMKMYAENKKKWFGVFGDKYFISKEDYAKIESIKNQLISIQSKLNECNISHGDLHAGNILITDDNIVKIIDPIGIFKDDIKWYQLDHYSFSDKIGFEAHMQSLNKFRPSDSVKTIEQQKEEFSQQELPEFSEWPFDETES